MVRCKGLTLLLVTILALAVESKPWGQLVKRSEEDRIPGQYIVVLKPGFKADAFIQKFSTISSTNLANMTVMYVYRNVFDGFAAKLPDLQVNKLLAMEEVSYVEENGMVKSQFTPGSWGIDRVDQRYLPLDGQAEFTGDGSGVSVYVLDTGIYPDNTYFAGRAQVAYDAVGGGQKGIDCNGHGTHCAGTVGADLYGIASGAALYGVRVLNCLGSGSNAQVIAGLDWVAANGQKPAVASMSLGGGPSTSLDNAVARVVQKGIPVSVAAGNNDADACQSSPPRSPDAITVGATDMQDVRAYFSAYGTCVDIFAPGVDITSTWYTGASAINTISGTSMACPHVTGALAIALGNDRSLSPEELRAKIIDDSTKNVVVDPEEGSPNRLLYIP